MEHNKVHKFYESIKSRMLVAEVIERIRAGGKGRTADTDSEFSAIDERMKAHRFKNIPGRRMSHIGKYWGPHYGLHVVW